jgi:hypothetical protein
MYKAIFIIIEWESNFKNVKFSVASSKQQQQQQPIHNALHSIELIWKDVWISCMHSTSPEFLFYAQLYSKISVFNTI